MKRAQGQAASGEARTDGAVHRISLAALACWGLGKWRDAGPFQPHQWTVDLSAPNTPPPDVLEPWL